MEPVAVETRCFTSYFRKFNANDRRGNIQLMPMIAFFVWTVIFLIFLITMMEH